MAWQMKNYLKIKRGHIAKEIERERQTESGESKSCRSLSSEFAYIVTMVYVS